MDYDGFYFYYMGTHDSVKNPDNPSRYYPCSKYRSTGCRARLFVTSDGVSTLQNQHLCQETRSPSVSEEDVREEMRLKIERRATTELRVPPARLCEETRDAFRLSHGNRNSLHIFRRAEAISLIRRVRNELNGGDVIRAIEGDDYQVVSEEDKRDFLQFNVAYSTGDKYRRILGFGHPDLIRQMRDPGITLFIDGTFKITPRPFTQTVIIMMYDSAHDYYVPCFYVLVDNKDKLTYTLMFQCELKCNPKVVVCDFEHAIHQDVEEQFKTPKVNIVGCLFHWKQAIRRKMIEVRIPADQIEVAMTPGYIDVLTVIPEHKIRLKGIPYVIRKVDRSIDRQGIKDRWTLFWTYFVKTWCNGQYKTKRCNSQP